ncbi:cytochrome P450 [Solwaraspora sp. WMMB335]|uniref:cytochrome P450 n=1 Tax=Solwaraspora sp. WMMB335 TaxID=3404118 RepID=UPI003B965DA3
MDLHEQQCVLDWPFPRAHDGTVPAILDELRKDVPCAVTIPAGTAEARRAWLVTRHPDVQQALMDPRLSADELLPGAPLRIQLPPGDRPSSFLRMDDPEHNRLRSMITSQFTARRVRAMQPAIEALAERLLDDVETRPRPVDLHDAFSRKLPTLVVANLIGVPDEDSSFFVEKTRMVMYQDDPAKSFAAYQDMSNYLAELAQRRQHDPQDDLISQLVVNNLATGEISLNELIGIARLVLVAGHETTTNQIALNTLSLLLDADLLKSVLADDGARVPQFIEESMRFWSISQDAIVRLALEDLELGGRQMRKGDAVVISIPAGNHDPKVFPNPRRIDIQRNTQEHLQWGIGPHYCQGAPLARLEMAIAVKSLFARFPTLRLATDRPETLFRRNTVFHGLESLPVEW